RRTESGAQADVTEGRRTENLPAPCVSSGPDPRERQMARTQVDVAHLARHGVPQTDAVRADPPQQPRADTARPRPPTSADAAGRSRGTGRDERKGRLSLDIERRGRGVHLARVPSIRNSASHAVASGSKRSP